MTINTIGSRTIQAAAVLLTCISQTACSSTNATVSQKSVVITDSLGGSVPATFKKYRGWVQDGKRIVVDGRVHSADAFAAFSMPGACYTKNAIFSPHAASTLGLVPNYQLTARLTRGLPAPLAKEFRANANYYNWVTTAKIPYAKLKEIWPEGAC